MKEEQTAYEKWLTEIKDKFEYIIPKKHFSLLHLIKNQIF